MKATLILIILLISSCTNQRLCRRAERKGCHQTKSDTLILHDTIQGFIYDTIVKYSDSSYTDTLIVNKDGVTSKVIIKWKDRIVEQTITKRDTVLERIQVTNTKIVKPQLKWYQKYWWAWILVGMAYSALMIWIAKV